MHVKWEGLTVVTGNTVSIAMPGGAGGLGAWIGIQGGLWGNKNHGAAAKALIGITAAGTVGGYFLGNSIDKQWTVIEILP